MTRFNFHGIETYDVHGAVDKIVADFEQSSNGLHAFKTGQNIQTLCELVLMRLCNAKSPDEIINSDAAVDIQRDFHTRPY